MSSQTSLFRSDSWLRSTSQFSSVPLFETARLFEPANLARTGALIVAAGLSSRMGAFKPLLPLGASTLLETAVITLQDAGVREMVIVTGHRAEDIATRFAGKNIQLVHNEHYAETPMFDSARLGLAALEGRCDRFFFLPADVTLFSTLTLRLLVAAMDQQRAGVARPTYGGKSGHPVLIDGHWIGSILQDDGRDGMRGALARLEEKTAAISVSVPDLGILLDADTPEDYEMLRAYQGRMNRPDVAACRLIRDWLQVPSHIAAHCDAVAEQALELTDGLIQCGHPVDRTLVESAARLHDVARTCPDHAAVGAEWLRALGYPDLAEVVAVHMNLPLEVTDDLDARAIVYLADKLVEEDRRVTVERRFDEAIRRCGHDPEALAEMLARRGRALRIQERIRAIVSAEPDEP